MKRIIALVLSSVLAVSSVINVSAEPDYEMPGGFDDPTDYLYTFSINNTLSIQSHTASCKSVVMGASNMATKNNVED